MGVGAVVSWLAMYKRDQASGYQKIPEQTIEIGNAAECRRQLEINLGVYFGTEKVWLSALQNDPRQGRAGGLRAGHPAHE